MHMHVTTAGKNMSAYRGDRLGQPLVSPDVVVYTEDEPFSVPPPLALPVCLLLQVRGGVCGVEHCPGQPRLCTLFHCLHQQLPRPGVSPIPLSQAAALLGSGKVAASGKERPRSPGGAPRGAQPPALPHLRGGDVPQEIQIKVTSLG